MLTLSFFHSAPTLPWRADRDVEAELPLRGVTHLTLNVRFEYSAEDAEELSRWLGRFPELAVLNFRGQSVPSAAHEVLAQTVAKTRTRMGAGTWRGVFFDA